MNSYLVSQLQTQQRSRRDELMSAAAGAPEDLDMKTTNLLGHMSRHWTLRWTWEDLLQRLAALPARLTADQIWDLRMICQAGQHEAFKPSGCQVLLPGFERPERAFSLTCARLWHVFSHPPTRQAMVLKLKKHLDRIQQHVVRVDD